jgi:flagellar hook-length control protein FliK
VTPPGTPAAGDTPATPGDAPKATTMNAPEALPTVATPLAADAVNQLVNAAAATPASETLSGEVLKSDRDRSSQPVSSVSSAVDHIGAMSHTTHTAEAAPIESPAPAAPIQPPHTQIVSAVTPLRQEGDGSYTLSLELHPAELGRVHVEVHMNGGELSLHIRAENQDAGNLLRHSLSDLRRELQAAGVGVGDLEVGVDGQSSRHGPTTPGMSNGGGDRRSNGGQGSGRGRGGEQSAPANRRDTVSQSTDSALDLRL